MRQTRQISVSKFFVREHIPRKEPARPAIALALARGRAQNIFVLQSETYFLVLSVALMGISLNDDRNA
jgi:hypothetical protein